MFLRDVTTTESCCRQPVHRCKEARSPDPFRKVASIRVACLFIHRIFQIEIRSRSVQSVIKDQRIELGQSDMKIPIVRFELTVEVPDEKTRA
jgi:hypothetical protein